MSDELDELARAARNRGLRLVKSRIRTPNKRLFGKAALLDAKGEKLFGFDDKGRPSVNAKDIARFLKTQDESDWSASLKRRKKP